MAKVGKLVKESIVDELNTLLTEHEHFFVTGIRQLPVEETMQLRKQLVGSNARLFMVKRTLGKRILTGLEVSGLTDLAEVRDTSVGFVVTDEDPTVVAKQLKEFGKEHADSLEIHGARVEGQILGKARAEEFAGLPPKEVLLGQVITLLEAPINEVAVVLERLIGDLIQVVDQAAAKVPAASAKVSEEKPTESNGPAAETEAAGEPKATEASTEDTSKEKTQTTEEEKPA